MRDMTAIEINIITIRIIDNEEPKCQLRDDRNCCSIKSPIKGVFPPLKVPILQRCLLQAKTIVIPDTIPEYSKAE